MAQLIEWTLLTADIRLLKSIISFNFFYQNVLSRNDKIKKMRLVMAYQEIFLLGRGGGVKWSACLPPAPTIQV